MRAQPALEFLSTYSWALILVILFTALVAVFATIQNKEAYPPSHCYITPSLPCYSMYVMENSIGTVALVVFTNELGSQISFPSESFVVSPSYAPTTYSGRCIPANVMNGAVVACNAILIGYHISLGTELAPSFEVKYSICSSGVCSGPLPLYNTSGSAELVVSPYTPNYLDSLGLRMPLVEIAYPAGAGTVLPGNGIYDYGAQVTIQATPTPGNTFIGWCGIGVGSYSGTEAINSITIHDSITENAIFQEEGN